MNNSINTDVVIIGGGIAGLWCLNHLSKLGYKVLLLESTALGHGQTICSQGILHGGLKYALTGKITHSAEAVQSMPSIWQSCIENKSPLDLSSVNVLSKHQYLWSTGSLKANLLNFFGSKAFSAAISLLDPAQQPSYLQGTVYDIHEWVIDIPSLLQCLSSRYKHQILHIDPHTLVINNRLIQCNRQYSFETKAIVFTAGQSNADFVNTPKMQKRPLHMVLCKFPETIPPLYGHCMDGQRNPRITITSHLTHDNKIVFYLGGQLAETGVSRSQEAQIAFAQKELKALLSHIDLANTQWASFFIDRAEALQPGNKRPEAHDVQTHGGNIVVWPTKLVLAPAVGHQVQQQLELLKILPSHAPFGPLPHWPIPPIAKPMWETLF